MKIRCSQYCETGKMFYVEYMSEYPLNPFYKEYEGKCWKRFLCKRYWADIRKQIKKILKER